MRCRLRTLLIALAAGALFGVALYACRLVPIETIYRIQVGMTQAEVEALAGRPFEISSSPYGGEYWSYASDLTDFVSPAMVEFDRDGRVVSTWKH